MDEFIIGIGADNSKLVKTIENAATRVDKFLTSKQVSELKNLEINIKGAKLNNVLDNYEKHVSNELKKISKNWFIGNGDNKIDLGLGKGVKDALALDTILSKITKNRDNIYSEKGRKISSSSVDSVIRKLELAKNSNKEFLQYLSQNNKEVNALLQSMINIENLKSKRVDISDKTSTQVLREQLALNEKIRKETNNLNKKTSYKGFDKELEESDRIIANLKERLELRKKEKKAAEQIDKLESKAASLEKRYNETPTDDYQNRIKYLQKIIALEEEIRANNPNLAPNLENRKAELAAIQRINQEQKNFANIQKKEQLISGYDSSLSSTSDDNQRLNILNKMKSEWEAIRKLQGGFLDSRQLGEYNRVLGAINSIKNATRQQNEESRKQKKLNQEIANLQGEIAKKEGLATRNGAVTNIGEMRNKRSELKNLIKDYERLHKAQAKKGIPIDTTGISRARKDLAALEHQMRKMNGFSLPFASTLGHLFGGYQIARFARTIAETTGYFQAQKIAMESILQDAGEAQKLFNQLKSFSLKSPFEFKDLLTQTKQLSAFQVPTEELFETTKRLGDLSAGLGVDMNRLILAYGQVRSAAFLRGQEVRQFTEAGVPLVQALADKFTVLEGRVVSTGEVFERISKRMVSFEMVKDVLWGLTDETGKFYNMQETLANTTQGKILNLRDVWNQALERIGSGNISIINGVLDTFVSMLKNAEHWLKALIGIAVSYAVSRWSKSIKWLNLTWANFVAKVRSATISIKGFKTAMAGLSVGNWIALIATIAGAIWGLVSKWKSAGDELKKSLNELNASFDKETSKLVKNFKKLANEAVNSIDGTEKQLKVIEMLKTQYQEYIPLMDLEIEKLKAMRGEYDLLTESIKNAQEAKKIQAQKEEVFGKANEHYFGEDNEFSKIFNKSDVLMDIGLGRKISYFGDNKSLKKQVVEDLSASFSKLLEKGEPITLKSLYDAAQEVSDLYIRDNYYYKRVLEVSRKSAKALFEDMSSNEYSKTLTDIYRREGRVNPLKNKLDQKTQEYEESLKTLPVQGKTSEQIKKDKDLLSMGLMYDQIGIVQKELYKALNEAKPNLTNDEYSEYLKRTNDIAEFFNNIGDAYIEVLKNTDEKTSADDDVENLYSLVSTYTSKLQNVDKILSGTFFNLTNIFGTFLNNVGWLYDWQRDVNSYIDESGDNELKNFTFSSNNINEDGTRIREDFEKKIQNEYDKAKSELEKYKTLNSNNYSNEELEAIKKGYEEKMLHMKELAKFINYDIEKQSDSGGSKTNWEDVYNKRLSAFEKFVNKYSQLLKTYSHEKAVEILQADEDGLISQFVTTDPNKTASRVVAKNGVEYKAGLGGYKDWNAEEFIKDPTTFKEWVGKVTKAEIELARNAKISATGIQGLLTIMDRLANIGIASKVDEWNLAIKELGEQVKETNEAISLFQSLLSLGVSTTEAASISGHIGGLTALYGSKVSSKKAEITGIASQNLGTVADGLGLESLSNTEEIDNAIEKVKELKTNLSKLKEDAADEEKQQYVAPIETMKTLLDGLRELRSLHQEEIVQMKEIVGKYSLLAKKQAIINKYAEESAKLGGEDVKMTDADVKMTDAIDSLELNTNTESLLGKELSKVLSSTSEIDYSKNKALDELYIKTQKEQLEMFYGDFSNVSGKAIMNLQDRVKGLRESLVKAGKATPEMTKYLDDLDIALIKASKGAKSFFDNLSMKGLTKRDTADEMVERIRAFAGTRGEYNTKEEALNQAKQNLVGVKETDENYAALKAELDKAQEEFDAVKGKVEGQKMGLVDYAMQNYKEPDELIDLVLKIYEAITTGKSEEEVNNEEQGATDYASDTQNVSNTNQNVEKRIEKLGNAKGQLQELNNIVSAGQGVIDAFSSAFDAVGNVVAAFGDKTEGATEAFEEIGYFMDDLSSAYGMISPLIGVIISIVSAVYVLTAAGYSLQAAFWPILIIGLALAAIAALVAGVMYAFKKHDRDLEEQIEDRKNQIEKLQNQLEQLEWEEETSGDPLKNLNERLNILKQIEAEQKAILDAEEEKKKKDDDAIAEAKADYEQSVRDTKDAIIAARDEIIGSAKDISQALGDALFDAFAEGENAARAMSKSIKTIIGDAIKNAFVTKLILPKINKILEETFGTDENGNLKYDAVLDPAKVDELAEKLNMTKQQLIDLFNNMPDKLKEYFDGMGDNTLTSGVEQITESTAGIIASYMNSVRETLVIQSGYVKSISVDVLAIREEFLPDIQSHIVKISTNTDSINMNTASILEKINSVIRDRKINVTVS